MPRGGRPMPLEELVPYFRGARFALLAMKRRHGRSNGGLAEDVDRYVAMVDHYSQAAIETYRLKRERQSESP